MFEISLAHKSYILHACHEKANYMRVGHVALNSAESDSSNTHSYNMMTMRRYCHAKFIVDNFGSWNHIGRSGWTSCFGPLKVGITGKEAGIASHSHYGEESHECTTVV